MKTIFYWFNKPGSQTWRKLMMISLPGVPEIFDTRDLQARNWGTVVKSSQGTRGKHREKSYLYGRKPTDVLINVAENKGKQKNNWEQGALDALGGFC